jgi:DNA-binding CsgD family transcriptional regulator
MLGVQPRKTFVLEDREIFRVFLGRWLRERGGHEVRFFDSAEALRKTEERRDVELLAAHLLPGRIHFHKNGHGYGVYGEGLDATTVLWCRKSGVRWILDLRDRAEEWNRCLEGMAKGESMETASVVEAVRQGQGKGVMRLSRRENEVARMLVKGFSAKQVAAALGTSEGTVKNQRKAVYRKLGIVRATQLAGAMGYRAR